LNKAEIFYKDIGDYLSREEKLKIVKESRSILNPALEMVQLKPNEHGDWISMRNSMFDEFIPIEPVKKFDNKSQSFFTTYAIGVATNRDAWVNNFSEKIIKKNMKKTISFYNEQRKLNENDIDTNPEKISWTVNLKKDLENNILHKFIEKDICIGLHRPFTKEWIYYNKSFIERPGLWSQLFPSENNKNYIICVTGIGVIKDFSPLITNAIPDLQVIANGQCFPLYWYEKKEKTQGGLFEDSEDDYIRRDAISDFELAPIKYTMLSCYVA